MADYLFWKNLIWEALVFRRTKKEGKPNLTREKNKNVGCGIYGWSSSFSKYHHLWQHLGKKEVLKILTYQGKFEERFFISLKTIYLKRKEMQCKFE